MGSRRIPLYNRIDRFCLPHYEAVISVSERLRAQCLACGVPAGRCVLIENAIDLQQYERRTSRDEAKRALGIPPHRQVIGAVGRLSAEKGFDILIGAISHLLERGFDVDLIIVGEGDQRRPLETLISESGHGDRIHLLGYRSDTLGCYESMDIYALSSLSEGLPNVILEAMALRIPVVATGVGAVPQLIAHERNGLLVEPGDKVHLGIAVARLLSDADLRIHLGEAGRRTVESRYSFERRMEQIRAIYDELLAVPCVGVTP
jgi:glycosyltransferase involved in cell wall biosynthesis